MKTIKIGNQVWTKKNLRVFTFRNGEYIHIVQDRKEWNNLTCSAMCINPYTEECYYNWYAVIDPRGLAPEGFHVPSDEEWEQLIDECGGNKIAGFHLKSREKWDGNNTTGFNARPTGSRSEGYFYNLGDVGRWWSSSQDASVAFSRELHSEDSNVRKDFNAFQYGLSVRLIQD